MRNLKLTTSNKKRCSFSKTNGHRGGEKEREGGRAGGGSADAYKKNRLFIQSNCIIFGSMKSIFAQQAHLKYA